MALTIVTIVAACGWICAGVAFWQARRLRNAVQRTKAATPPSEVAIRLQLLTNVPAPTGQYAPGTSTTRPLAKRIKSST